VFYETIRLHRLRPTSAVPQRRNGGKLLGISLSSAYELMHEEGFPALRIGNRIVVPKEKFCRWVDRQTGGAR